ncbi:DUF1549 domain-containing protein [Tautonia plasticadhaerens]|uniref:Planctomycete cytochrome C n=1 Tax=Tautonia plasticadhaerens TaxID=2527974 RepID=A0A518HF07_9BACT|nr:PSD1 and planctomycete cytochrome C domain-containing protein [Tautonia plasticadhaerens]QDV39440.1 Planctomycete cytochrome C [Tautonia plasticadhaerens]
MISISRSVAIATALLAANPIFGGSATANESPDPASLEFFEARIRPILVENCYTCHSAETKPAGGLRVDDHQGLLDGGNSGPAIVPGDPGASLLIQRVTNSNSNRVMPKEGEPLTDQQVADLTLWIEQGALWPALKVPESLGKDRGWYEALRQEHWAWQPLTDPEVPPVSDDSWANDDIDRFLLAALDEAGLAPVGDADRATLLRRVTFDLTGLPPRPEELDAFLEDSSPDAFERVVDRLLDSPQFGERWGRHWLDVARYAESTGPSRNIPYPHAWRYRDYVIDAVNADVPFDRFVTEQIAGDLLPADSDEERDRLKIATGFLALGVKDVNQRFKVRFEMDNVDDQIDAATRSVLGLTVSCSRCHDHKFDPIPTADYYALAGIFTSTVNAAGLRNQMGGGGLAYYVPSLLIPLSGTPPPPPEEELKELEAKVAEAKAAWDAIRGTREGLARGPDGRPVQRGYRDRFEKLNAELLGLTDPAAQGFAVHGVRDAEQVGDTPIRIRGEAEKRGPTVPRGFLTAFEVPGAPAINPAQSGRRELAAWLTSEHNPLTPRVIVNRAWHHLHGRGIVSTVDNFGVTGDEPSHPELLDHLASRFVRDGWSIKRLVRAIALSRSYQLASEATPEHLDADPANTLVWRHAPRRLDAEQIRDAMLAAWGSLSLDRPEGSAARHLKMIEMRDNGPEAKEIHEFADASRSRSVYLPSLRGVTPKALEPFDPVEQTLVTGRREQTTVPAQALFLLNSTVVRREALAVAERLLGRDGDDDDRVRELYRLTLGRSPSDGEVWRALGFLAEYERSDSATDDVELVRVADEPEPAIGATVEVVDPDQVDQSAVAIAEVDVRPHDTRSAAWMALAQAIFASAEFRYIR